MLLRSSHFSATDESIREELNPCLHFLFSSLSVCAKDLQVSLFALFHRVTRGSWIEIISKLFNTILDALPWLQCFICFLLCWCIFIFKSFLNQKVKKTTCLLAWFMLYFNCHWNLNVSMLLREREFSTGASYHLFAKQENQRGLIFFSPSPTKNCL